MQEKSSRPQFNLSEYVQNFLRAEPKDFEFTLSTSFQETMGIRYAKEGVGQSVPDLLKALKFNPSIKPLYCRGSLIDSRYASTFVEWFLGDPKLFLSVFTPWIIDPETGRVHYYKINGKQVVRL